MRKPITNVRRKRMDNNPTIFQAWVALAIAAIICVAVAETSKNEIPKREITK
jgi:hypothetical protein